MRPATRSSTTWRGSRESPSAHYHLELQGLGYETAHIGKWHMGNDAAVVRYDYWVAFDGHGRLFDPNLNENGTYGSTTAMSPTS